MRKITTYNLNLVRRTFLLAMFPLLFSLVAFSQTTTKSAIEGNWNVGSNWVGESFPGTGTNDISVNGPDVVISDGSFIEVTRDLSFGNNNRTITVNGTLVVRRNMSFQNNGYQLVVNGLLVVLGDLNLPNQMVVGNDGIIIVNGTFNKTGSQNQGDYSGDGDVYSRNTSFPGDWVDPEADKDFTDLQNELPDIWNWINNGAPGFGPLPISLGSISYTTTSSSVLLQFTTTKEENFSHFEIQRSRNGQSWDVIGEVIGNGNTSEVQAYGFEDRNPLAGISYYRLNAIDIDGTQEYHGMLSVMFQPGNHAVEVYPNPVTTGVFNIQANFELREGAKIKVMDMVGAEILNVEFDGYQQEFTLPAKVREGLYVLIIEQDGLVYKKKLLVK